MSTFCWHSRWTLIAGLTVVYAGLLINLFILPFTMTKMVENVKSTWKCKPAQYRRWGIPCSTYISHKCCITRSRTKVDNSSGLIMCSMQAKCSLTLQCCESAVPIFAIHECHKATVASPTPFLITAWPHDLHTG